MDKKTNKILTFLCGFVLPIILTFLPLLKIILLDQQHFTGYMDGTAIKYLIKDLIINVGWAVSVFVSILWNIKNGIKLTAISNIFMALCALSGCYIVTAKSSILNFVHSIDTSAYTLETILVCLAFGLLIRRVYLVVRSTST